MHEYSRHRTSKILICLRSNHASQHNKMTLPFGNNGIRHLSIAVLTIGSSGLEQYWIDNFFTLSYLPDSILNLSHQVNQWILEIVDLFLCLAMRE